MKTSYLFKRHISQQLCIGHIKRTFTAQSQIQIEQIRNELSLALEHLPESIGKTIQMINPSYLDTNYLHRALHERPQYTCGYSIKHDIISIYFRHSDPTYQDIIHDLNIKHKAIILNGKRINIHEGFLSYLTNTNNKFIENITNELQLLNNTYKYDTSKTKLLITGLSLGSALSQLFYLLIYTDFHQFTALRQLIPLDLENIFVITFGSPSFVHCKDVLQCFNNDPFDELSERIFNFHSENDPIPMLLTGSNEELQRDGVLFREVLRCSDERKLQIASNFHIGNNYILMNDKCIKMEEDKEIKEEYLMNGANHLWKNKICSMIQLLTLLAKNHLPHQYKHRLQKVLENN